MRPFFILLKDNLQTAIKSKKALIFLVIYLAVFSLIVYAIKEVQRELFQELARQQNITPELSEVAFSFFKEFLKVNSNEVIRAVISLPLYSIELFAVTLVGTPVLVLLVHYDKLAQEISDGTFRYQLFRVSRAQIYWAKFASAMIEIAMVTLVATLLAVLYGHFNEIGFSTPYVLKASLNFWWGGLPFLFSFSALIFCFSAWVKRPFSALLFSAAAIVAAAVVMIWLPQISPFYLEYWKGFFLPGTSFMLRSVLIYIGFTILFSGLGFLIFRKRDL